jgi:hypothetical protein
MTDFRLFQWPGGHFGFIKGAKIGLISFVIYIYEFNSPLNPYLMEYMQPQIYYRPVKPVQLCARVILDAILDFSNC